MSNTKNYNRRGGKSKPSNPKGRKGKKEIDFDSKGKGQRGAQKGKELYNTRGKNSERNRTKNTKIQFFTLGSKKIFSYYQSSVLQYKGDATVHVELTEMGV